MSELDLIASRHVLEQVDSTNREAERLMGAGGHEGWVLGRQQTQGRGRRGREWVSARGNLYASYFTTTQMAARKASLMSFVAAIALYNAVVTAGLPKSVLGLKWPNDVLIEGKKFAGLLLEMPKPNQLIIGFGVNLMTAPDIADYGNEIVSLRDYGIAIDPDDFLDLLAIEFSAYAHQFQQEGFDVIRKHWLDRAQGLEGEITARMPKKTITGRFVALADDGALVLENPCGRHEIHAADIYLGGG